MRAKRLALVGIALAVVCGPLFAQIARVVRSAEELLRAIGPDRTIVLDAQTFRISRVQGAVSEYVSMEETYDGVEVVIEGVENLTLRGRYGTAILADPRYAFVLTFRDSGGIRLEGLVLGHTEAGECAGGVLRIERCWDVEVTDCELYGSGTIAVEIAESEAVRLVSTTIRDCTGSAVHAYDSWDIRVDWCGIYANQAYPLFELTDCGSVRFDSCSIRANEGYAFFTVWGDPSWVELSDCDIEGNRMDYFSTEDEWPQISNNRWEGNEFGDLEGEPGEVQERRWAEGEWRYHIHAPSGLGFTFPGWWQMQEDSEGFLGIVSPEGNTGIVFAPLSDLETSHDPDQNPAGVMEDAYAYLSRSAEEEGDRMMAEESDPVVGVEFGLPSQTIRGMSTVSGEELPFVLRLFVVSGEVYAMLAMFYAGSEATDGETVEAIVTSVDWGYEER